MATAGETYEVLVSDARQLVEDVKTNQACFDLEGLFYRRDRTLRVPSVIVTPGCSDLGNWSAPNTSQIIDTHFGFFDDSRRAGFSLLRFMKFLDPVSREEVGTVLTTNPTIPNSLYGYFNVQTAMYQRVSGGVISGWENPGLFPQVNAPNEYRAIKDLDPHTSIDDQTEEAIVTSSVAEQLRISVVLGQLLLEGQDPREAMEFVGWEYPQEFLGAKETQIA